MSKYLGGIRGFLLGHVALIWLAGCGAAPESFEQEAAPATAQSNIYAVTDALWPAPKDSVFTRIGVCWENGTGYETEMGWAQDAVQASWQAVSFVRFEGWGPCSTKPEQVHININDSNPRVSGGIGTQLDLVYLNFTYKNWDPGCQGNLEYCIRSNAAHEFGHVLGIAHEQNRPDSPCDQTQGSDGDSYFAYDPDSIMNYCRPNSPNLSAGDIDGIQRLYGGNFYHTLSGKKYALANAAGGNLYFSGPVGRSDASIGIGSLIMNAGITVTVPNANGAMLQYGNSVYLANNGFLGIQPESRTNTTQLVAGAGGFLWEVGRPANFKWSQAYPDVRNGFTLSAVVNNVRYYLGMVNNGTQRGDGLQPVITSANGPNTTWRFIGPIDQGPAQPLTLPGGTYVPTAFGDGYQQVGDNSNIFNDHQVLLNSSHAVTRSLPLYIPKSRTSTIALRYLQPHATGSKLTVKLMDGDTFSTKVTFFNVDFPPTGDIWTVKRFTVNTVSSWPTNYYLRVELMSGEITYVDAVWVE